MSLPAGLAVLMLVTAASSSVLSNPFSQLQSTFFSSPQILSQRSFYFPTSTYPNPIADRQPEAVSVEETPKLHAVREEVIASSMHKQEVSPRLTYYIPTGKCPNTYFCRAEMTAYKEFMGKTKITIGYSIWNFFRPFVAIPGQTIAKIQTTTDKELFRYIEMLAHAIGSEYPNQGRLCHITVKDAYFGIKKSISQLSSCRLLKNAKCERTVTIGAC